MSIAFLLLVRCSLSVERKNSWYRFVTWNICWLVSFLSVRKVYCGKRLSASGCHLGGELGQLRVGVIIKGEGAVLGVNLGYPIVTNGDILL